MGSYGLILLCCMGWFAKKIPMRIYYDEANDKTFAIFMHLLIPFRFSKKSLPHHSFRIIKNSKEGYRISNGQLNLMITPEMFRKPVDFTRLLSQWIKSFVEIVSGAFENVEKVAMLVHVDHQKKVYPRWFHKFYHSSFSRFT